MKTTVELPDAVLVGARQYAAARGKTFREVLIEALDLLMFNGAPKAVAPGWEQLFGAFADRPEVSSEIAEVQERIDREFGSIDFDSWK